jgi:DNA-3-methyladenine glycosylase I
MSSEAKSNKLQLTSNQSGRSGDDDGACDWCLSTPLYRQYHDEEWGRPCTDSKTLFELINLEGAQAGLSWITILNKREHYRKVFHRFDPVKVAKMTDAQLEKLVADPGIVRHGGKIQAVRGNAQAFLAMQDNGEDFADFVWSFVNHKPKQNKPRSLADVPSKTEESDALCKALKKRGFKFVGSTICYAFMQAAGLVNDHVISCPMAKPCAQAGRSL